MRNILKFFCRRQHGSKINTVTPCNLKQKPILKRIQENNLKIGKPKNTVRGLQRVDCLCFFPWQRKHFRHRAEIQQRAKWKCFFFLFFVKTPVMLRMQEKFFSFFSLWAIARAAAEIFCNCEYKRRWFIRQSSCGSHDERVWGLWHWHAHTSYSLVWSSVLQLTHSLFFSISGLHPKVSECLACGFRSSPITMKGLHQGKTA